MLGMASDSEIQFKCLGTADFLPKFAEQLQSGNNCVQNTNWAL